MNIKCIKTGFLEENCYILEKNNECLIIDPGSDFDKIKSNIKSKVLGVLLTHRHYDHIGALEQLLNEYKVPVYEKMNLDEENYKLGNFSFNVIFTGGHSEDSVTYYFYKNKVMFTGDFLFFNNIGRCDLEGGNFSEMKKSIDKIKRYSGDIKIYPGHGVATNLSREKEKNVYFNS